MHRHVVRSVLCSLALSTFSIGCLSDTDPCGGSVTCVDTFPYDVQGSTVGSLETSLAAYSCGDAALDGAETIYRITLSDAGFLAAQLVTDSPDSRLQLRLLDARDGMTCRDGHGTRAGSLLAPGDYYIVVDGPSGSEGTFELKIGLTTAASLTALGIQHGVEDALRVFDTAWRRGDTERFEYSIVDFSMHSSVKRQWYVDLATQELLYNLHVAHGRGDHPAFVDTGFAPGFSNVPDTHLSSFGVMRSAEAYVGMYGSSFRIDGLEPGINDNVRPRAIVMHPWEGSRPEFVATKGETQPTWGCPAVDDRLAPAIADRFHGGVLMFFWYPDWVAQSTYLSAD